MKLAKMTLIALAMFGAAQALACPFTNATSGSVTKSQAQAVRIADGILNSGSGSAGSSSSSTSAAR